MSRLVDGINAQLAMMPTREQCYRLLTRRAIYFSQKGDVPAAKSDVLKIRSSLMEDGSPVGTILVNLAEATILFQAGSTNDAIVKARRAYALGRSIAACDLISASAAWLSHYYFNQRMYMEAVSFARESLFASSASDRWVVARVSLVVGSMFHYFGDFSSARTWYERARTAAVEEGDEVMIGLIIYNSSALRLNNIRLAEVGRCQVDEVSSTIELEIESSSNFDRGIGSLAFPDLLPILRVQILTYNCNYAESVDAFNKMVCGLFGGDFCRLPVHLRADYAWSLLNIGLDSEARALICSLPKGVEVEFALDEMAMMFHRLKMAAHFCSDVVDARLCKKLSLEALAGYNQFRTMILPALREAF